MPVIVFIHQNMPGQFKNICQALAKNEKNTVYFITKKNTVDLPNVRRITYDLSRKPTGGSHQYISGLDSHLLYGQAVARKLLALKENNVQPDIIFAHSGWGEALFVKEIFPKAKLVVFSEFYYESRYSDTAFTHKGDVPVDTACKLVARNLHLTQSMMAADIIMTPTLWQKFVHPRIVWPQILTLHEGIAVGDIRANRKNSVTLPNGWTLNKGDRVITYVSRNLEPYRGFDVFFEALKLLARAAPDVKVVLIGGDDISYGKRPKGGTSWRDFFLHQEGPVLENAAFLGKVPYPMFLDLLGIAKVHAYLTVPFVLSWSMLEAMALETLVVASATDPVREVIADGKNGLLCDYTPQSVCDNLLRGLAMADEERGKIGRLARATVEQNYSFDTVYLPGLVDEVRARCGIDLIP
ncbi:glycosyltransferase [Thalassobaculum sp. OXR-137]|uniref:glycosyltransferase n=1 Tax=Thalassobaculum sp. OXR-137 TaxID=3100173 RepID=UPI002AC8A4AA|nr:glycosyltransferase [Thalassobaculum sp. OXR-137]WPZ36199.1 glycosyltransferase [Thalassobaculum sp. OXR-137]